MLPQDRLLFLVVILSPENYMIIGFVSTSDDIEVVADLCLLRIVLCLLRILLCFLRILLCLLRIVLCLLCGERFFKLSVSRRSLRFGSILINFSAVSCWIDQQSLSITVFLWVGSFEVAIWADTQEIYLVVGDFVIEQIQEVTFTLGQ